jgi:DNA-binding CsgD family transcriptional regulator
MERLLENGDVGLVGGASCAVRPTTIVVRSVTRRPLFTAAIQQFVSTSCHPMRVETSERTDTPDVVVLDGMTALADQPDHAEELGEVGVPVLVVGGMAPAPPGARRTIVAWLPEEVDAPAFCRAVLDASRGIVRPRRDSEDHGLSPREREVLRLIADGLTNEQIADHIFLSINTVKTYVRTAYRKVGVTSRAQAVRWMLRGC